MGFVVVGFVCCWRGICPVGPHRHHVYGMTGRRIQSTRQPRPAFPAGTLTVPRLRPRCRAEDRALLPPAERSANGYRYYGHDTLSQIAGLTLAQIHGILRIRDNGLTPCTHVRTSWANNLWI
jgi:hypothetical protein